MINLDIVKKYYRVIIAQITPSFYDAVLHITQHFTVHVGTMSIGLWKHSNAD